MGTWGPKLYQNDVSDDVRSEYKDKLRRGMKEEEVTDKLIETYKRHIEDVDDRANFWLALADTQWELGRLEERVKEQALKCIADGGDIKIWEEDSPKYAKIRARVYVEVKEKLLSPQPPKKEMKQYKLYQCDWKLGDVFAYKMVGEDAQKSGMLNRYLLVQMIDIGTWYPGHTTPIVYVKLTADDRLPKSINEYNSLEYVKFGKWSSELIKHKTESNLRYGNPDGMRSYPGTPDENGEVYEYRIQLIHTSKRSIPKELIYVGNFADADAPRTEGYFYYSNGGINLRSYRWRDIESRVLLNYSLYNN